MALIQRNLIRTIGAALARDPLVLLQGPPRCGISTALRLLSAGLSSGATILDARLPEGQAILAAPEHASALRPIFIDNASSTDATLVYEGLLALSRHPGYGEATRTRRPRFILGGGPFNDSIPIHLAKGMVHPLFELGPFCLFEVGTTSLRRLWLRGGYPEAFLKATDAEALIWLQGYAADLAYGDLGTWGLPRDPRLTGGLLRAVAVHNGEGFNANAASRALGVSRPTIVRQLDILRRAGVLMSVPAIGPEGSRDGVRAIKAPALYISDSGLLHALIGIRTADELAQKPGAAARSWTGFIVGQAIAVLPSGASLHHFSSADGAALDIVIVKDGRPILLAAARRHRPISVERSISYAARAIAPTCTERYIVTPDEGERSLPGGFRTIGAGSFLDRVASATA